MSDSDSDSIIGVASSKDYDNIEYFNKLSKPSTSKKFKNRHRILSSDSEDEGIRE